MSPPRSSLDPRFIAGVELLRRTGATSFRIGFSDDDDGPPVVFYAVATWPTGAEAAGALDPVTAVMRLCEQVVDGGECAHCHRATIFDSETGGAAWVGALEAVGCVYAWDPELSTFRRGCEGET